MDIVLRREFARATRDTTDRRAKNVIYANSYKMT